MEWETDPDSFEADFLDLNEVHFDSLRGLGDEFFDLTSWADSGSWGELGHISFGLLSSKQRSLGKAPEGCATRTWFDAIPLLGWYRLRRESPVHGRRFWVWPLLIELLFPIALLGLYWYEMQGGLLAKDAIQLVRTANALDSIPRSCIIDHLSLDRDLHRLE